MASSSDSDLDLNGVESDDSDKELQVAFSSGLLKPGLNAAVSAPKKIINDVAGLKQSLGELRKDLPWAERLALTVDPISMSKALDLEETVQQFEGDDIHNDFKREMRFYRQAQAAVLEGIPKLQKLGIPTKRPNDYLAEMAKSDEHMEKIRKKLLSKSLAMERSEKAKKLRDLRKYGKKVQQEVLQKRQKEKREMMEAVKKYRKGKDKKLDFLDDAGESGKGNRAGQKNTMQPNKKRQSKNKQYGFGGQKKRSKMNTKDSASDLTGWNFKKHGTRPGKFGKGKFSKGTASAAQKRPGKKRRQKNKNKK